MTPLRWYPAFVIVLAGIAGCHGDPRATADAAIARGDRYVANHQLAEAIIEYRRAIQSMPARVDVHMKLANAYVADRQTVQAYAEFSRACDLDPSLVDAQVEAGNLLLDAGEFLEAKARAEAAIATDARSARAHILLGNALAGLRNATQAVHEMEQAVALDPSSPEAYSALGAAQFAAASPRAGASFEKAVLLQPRSIDARIALANYHWAAGNHAAAEEDLRRALEIDPASAEVHRALALMALVDGRRAEAEPHFKALAAQSAAGRLALADFYSGTGRLDASLAILRTLAKDADLGRAAQIRTASVVQQQGHHDQALEIADDLIRTRPDDADAHMLKARLLLSAPPDPEAAWTEATIAVQANGESAAAQYTLGLAAVARHDYDAAESAFRRTLTLNPRAEAAALQLSRLRLARGDAAAAQNAAETAVRTRPDDVQAALVLARALRQRGELDRARRVVAGRLENTPQPAAGWIEMGEIELAAHHLSDARTALEHGRRAAAPDDERVQLLAARVDAASGNSAAAEDRLLELVRAHPDRLDAYELLAASALNRGNMADALARYRALAARVPDQVGPATMVGVLLQEANDRSGALAQYEAVLTRHPDAGIAANNLAWMLTEDGRYDEALRWADVGAESLRGRAEPQDTLGWVYLKMNRPADALAAFERARSLAPSEPLYSRHAADARKALGTR